MNMEPTRREAEKIEFLRKRGYRVTRTRRKDGFAWMYRVERPGFHNLPPSHE